MRMLIFRDILLKLKLPFISKETLSVYAFGDENTTEKTYTKVKIKLESKNNHL